MGVNVRARRTSFVRHDSKDGRFVHKNLVADDSMTHARLTAVGGIDDRCVGSGGGEDHFERGLIEAAVVAELRIAY